MTDPTPPRRVPRDPVTGERLCEYCMKPGVPASLGTKPRRYCSASCKQRAYESRRTQDIVRGAVANERRRAAEAAAASADPAKSRGVPEGTPSAESNARDASFAKSRGVPGTPRDFPRPTPVDPPEEAGTPPTTAARRPGWLGPTPLPSIRRAAARAEQLPLLGDDEAAGDADGV